MLVVRSRTLQEVPALLIVRKFVKTRYFSFLKSSHMDLRVWELGARNRSGKVAFRADGELPPFINHSTPVSDDEVQSKLLVAKWKPVCFKPA